jgi:hypothetical protein
MSACDPLIQAERRCKAHCLNRCRWDWSLAAGRWCPVARCKQYPQPALVLSNRVHGVINKAGMSRLFKAYPGSQLLL